MSGALESRRDRRFVSRLERFERLASTQDVVRGWLVDGVDEVCVAITDTQTAGRGRLERRWHAPAGRALLLSAGFRPVTLPPTLAWRLPAAASLAMLHAMTALLGPMSARLALKWPNDVVAVHQGRVLKVGGVLAEGTPEGDRMATAVVGIGANVDWPAQDFPAHLASTMWSLSEAAGGRAIDREALLWAWLLRLEPRYRALSEGHFDSRAWADAQVTTGAEVEVVTGRQSLRGIATGVDDVTGALLVRVRDEQTPRAVAFGEVVSCRVDPPASSL